MRNPSQTQPTAPTLNHGPGLASQPTMVYADIPSWVFFEVLLGDLVSAVVDRLMPFAHVVVSSHVLVKSVAATDYTVFERREMLRSVKRFSTKGG
jgi:hypothetical protein